MSHEQDVRVYGHSARSALGAGYAMLVNFTLNVCVLLTSAQTTHKKDSKAKNTVALENNIFQRLLHSSLQIFGP